MFSLMPANSGDLNGMGGEKVNTRGRNQVVLLRVRTCSCKERAMVSGAATIQCCNEACFHFSRRDFEVMRTLCGPDDNVGPRMRFLPRGEERLRQQESVTLATNLSTPRRADIVRLSECCKEACGGSEISSYLSEWLPMRFCSSCRACRR